MLLNAALARRALGEWSGAAAIHRHALATCGDHRQAHAAWLAVEATLAKATEEAQAARVVAATLDPPETRPFAELPLTVVQALDAPDAAAAREAMRSVLGKSGASRELLARVAGWLAERHGGNADTFLRLPQASTTPSSSWSSGIAWLPFALLALALLNQLTRECNPSQFLAPRRPPSSQTVPGR
jgi:hypothetical protein